MLSSAGKAQSETKAGAFTLSLFIEIVFISHLSFYLPLTFHMNYIVRKDRRYPWKDGAYLGHEEGPCYYSNNIVLKNKNQNNWLLVLYAEMYGQEFCVNVKHVWLSVEKHP